MLFTTKIHRFFFLLGIALSLCALPYSFFALSVGLITIAVNWLLDGCWREKIDRFASKKSLWVFCLTYLSIVVGFFYTDHFNLAVKELRLWLPLLLIPIMMATSEPLSKGEFKLLLILFCASVVVASFIGLGVYLKDFSIGSQNVRAISPYISHIRLALMVDFAIFILLYFSYKKEYFQSFILRSILFISSIWLIVFLFILQSFTGIVIFAITSFLMLAIWVFSLKNILLRFGSIVILASTLFICISYMAHTVDAFFTRNPVDFKSLPEVTANGNSYSHDTLSRQYENGNLVFVNVCNSELRNEWSKVSQIPFEGLDNSGQPIELTLKRYLASKGLTKDSVGMAKLDQVDVKLIENSVSSFIYREHRAGIYPRLYQTLWEVDNYLTSGNVGGSSVVQRYIFLKASWYVIKDNILFGVGTGDGADALKEYYKTLGSNLPEKYWFQSHNQYLTVWIASGIVGLILLLVGLLYPFFKEGRYAIFLCFAFQMIVLLSMLDDDTFDRHTGASFAAIFYGILFFSYSFRKDNQE